MKTNDTGGHVRRLEVEIEALLVAIVREVASHEFYRGLIEKHKDTHAGDIFRQLAEAETSHREQLESKLAELQADLQELKRRKTPHRTVPKRSRKLAEQTRPDVRDRRTKT
jgi:rubrerythrin